MDYGYSATYDASYGGLGWIMVVYWILMIGFYVYSAISLQKIAKKTNTPNPWLAWIPIGNIVLMLQISGKPVWWIILLFIPIVNLAWIVLGIMVWMAIAEKCGKPSWWGILLIVPGVNLIVPGYLAFSNSKQNA